MSVPRLQPGCGVAVAGHLWHHPGFAAREDTDPEGIPHDSAGLLPGAPASVSRPSCRRSARAGDHRGRGSGVGAAGAGRRALDGRRAGRCLGAGRARRATCGGAGLGAARPGAASLRRRADGAHQRRRRWPACRRSSIWRCGSSRPPGSPRRAACCHWPPPRPASRAIGCVTPSRRWARVCGSGAVSTSWSSTTGAASARCRRH